MSATATLEGDGEDQGPVRDEAELDLGYQVELEAFSGPLDLLLYLVRRAEVDVTEIPLVTIADQFVAAVANWEEMDLDVAGDFILMAATLLEIKARLVMPPELLEDAEAQDEEEDLVDPRADLIRQLLAFRRVKEAVQHLEGLERDRLALHHRRQAEVIPEDPEDAQGISLENADPYQLFAVWEDILKQIAGNRPRTVLYDDIPIEERIKQIDRTMREAREGELSWLMEQATSTVQRCGVVVAVLESVRQKVVEASQHEQYGPVYLRYRDEDERNRAPAPPPPEEDDAVGPDGKRKRRKKPPLFTYRAPTGEELAGDDGYQEELEEIEEVVVETDEQRFVRELNAETDIDNLLGRAKELDRHLTAHLVVQGVIAAPADFELPEGMVAPAVAPTETEDDDETADDEDDDFEDEYDEDDDEFDGDDDDDEAEVAASSVVTEDAEADAEPAADEDDGLDDEDDELDDEDDELDDEFDDDDEFDHDEDEDEDEDED